MSGEQAPRIRRQPVPDDAVFVVRGDEDTDRQTEAARFFLRRFPGWGRYGLSGWHATDEAEIDGLCRDELVGFPLVVVLRRAEVEAAGIEVVPTFRRPHVTLASADLAALLAVVAAATDRRANPYHGGGRS